MPRLGTRPKIPQKMEFTGRELSEIMRIECSEELLG